jgi:hypothetical protein
MLKLMNPTIDTSRSELRTDQIIQLRVAHVMSERPGDPVIQTQAIVSPCSKSAWSNFA